MSSTLLAVEWSQGVTDAWTKVAAFVPKLFGFLVILVVGYLVAKAVIRIIDQVLERFGFDRTVERGGVEKALERTWWWPVRPSSPSVVGASSPCSSAGAGAAWTRAGA